MRHITFSGVLFVILFCVTAIGQTMDPCPFCDNTLIVYNLNTTDGLEIAQYYAQERGISEDRISGVYLPTGQYATADQFMGARKQLIEQGVCAAIYDMVPPEDWPDPCDVTNLDAVAAVSPITHLVIVKGIPPRLSGTGWTDDFEEPSLDFMMSEMLYGKGDIFGATYNFALESNQSLFLGYKEDNIDWQPRDAIGSYMRGVDPALDKKVVYGRIEAMTAERTADLIDRTLLAERIGLSGNYLVGLKQYYSQWDDPRRLRLFNFFRVMTSSRDEACLSYLQVPYGEWPYDYCRAGASANGGIPGESTTLTLPKAINTGIFLNPEPNGNIHNAFDRFSTMLNWHKTKYECPALCSNFSNPEEQDSCRLRSTDYFKELNTECVGGAPGMMGWQLRSYPVQFYGFWPQGWEQTSFGPVLKTPPAVLSVGGYQNDQFADENYLRFGSQQVVENPQCVLEDGTVAGCKEFLGINLRMTKNTNVVISGSRDYVMRFRYRNESTPGALLYFHWRVRFDGDTADTLIGYTTQDVSVGHADWTTMEIPFSVAPVDGKMSYSILRFDISTTIASAPQGLFDLDGFELIDLETGENLCDESDNCSFTAGHQETHPGDYAANAIDRLGAIAWWGSSSHFQTGGFAFSNAENFIGAFSAGRSLGESLALAGYAQSGIIYGDPLYRPLGIKIFIGDGRPRLDNGMYEFHKFDDLGSRISVNAFNGLDNLDTTNWELAVCPGDDINDCDANEQWNTFYFANNGVFEQEIEATLLDLIVDENIDEKMILRLKVWNPGEDDLGLTNYAYVNYLAIPYGWDETADPIAGNHPPEIFPRRDEIDAVREELTGTFIYDFDLDGDELSYSAFFVDSNDIGTQGGEIRRVLLGDINLDGELDETDFSILQADLSRFNNPLFDVNEDGVISVNDLLAARDRINNNIREYRACLLWMPAEEGLYPITIKAEDGKGGVDYERVIIGVKDTVLHLRFNESGGTTAFDSSVNQLAGLLINQPLRGDGIEGGGLHFNGVNQYVGVADSELLKPIQRITVSAWVKPELNGEREFIATKWPGESLEIWTDGKPFFSVLINGKQYMTPRGSLQALQSGEWVHLTGTFDSGTRKLCLYINGGEQYAEADLSALESALMDVSDAPLMIGRYSNYYFSGLVDDVRVYDRAMTAEEVSAVYYEYKREVLLHMTFDADNSGVIADLSGKGNNGQLAGDAYVSDGRLVLDGDGDYVSLGSALADIDTYGGLNGKSTISVWVRPANTGEYNMVTQHVGGFDYLSAGQQNHLVRAMAKTTAGPNYWPASQGTISSGEWTNLTFVLEGGVGYKVYLNGVLDRVVKKEDLQLYSYGLTAFIGFGTAADNFFAGEIDDLMLYRGALAADEVREIYETTYSHFYGDNPEEVLHMTFDYAVGSEVEDLSGMGNSGWLMGDAQVSDGRLALDGLGDYVEVPSSESLKPTGRITVSGWIRPELNGAREFVATKWPGESLEIWTDGRPVFSVRINGKQYMTPRGSLPALQSGEWVHLTGTFDYATKKLCLYVNGGEQYAETDLSALESSLMDVSDAPLMIGRYSSYYFDGLMDDVRVYDRVLTAGEVYYLYNESMP